MRIPGLLLASLIAAMPLTAQEGVKWVGAQVGFQAQGPDSRGAKSATLFGAGGGVWFTDRWGADAAFRVANIDSNKGLGSGSQQYLTAAVLFNFLPNDKQWNLYAKAGFGSVRVEPPWSGSKDTTTKSVTLAGVGAQYRIGASGMLGAEVQLMRFNADYHEWPVVFTAGWRFGGVAKPAPRPAPKK
ncbi:MAG: porin family protein [Holophagaceae bacterium]|nr:porin family protein [Holophagaceae bacterium]